MSDAYCSGSSELEENDGYVGLHGVLDLCRAGHSQRGSVTVRCCTDE